MRRQGLGGRTSVFRMLEGVDVYKHTMNSKVSGVREVTGQEGLEDLSAALRSTAHSQAAACTSLTHFVSFVHNLVTWA